MGMLETLKALFRARDEEVYSRPVPTGTAQEYRELSEKFVRAAMDLNPGSEHQMRMAVHLLAKAKEVEAKDGMAD